MFFMDVIILLVVVCFMYTIVYLYILVQGSVMTVCVSMVILLLLTVESLVCLTKLFFSAFIIPVCMWFYFVLVYLSKETSMSKSLMMMALGLSVSWLVILLISSEATSKEVFCMLLLAWYMMGLMTVIFFFMYGKELLNGLGNLQFSKLLLFMRSGMVAVEYMYLGSMEMVAGSSVCLWMMLPIINISASELTIPPQQEEDSMPVISPEDVDPYDQASGLDSSTLSAGSVNNFFQELDSVGGYPNGSSRNESVKSYNSCISSNSSCKL